MRCIPELARNEQILSGEMKIYKKLYYVFSFSNFTQKKRFASIDFDSFIPFNNSFINLGSNTFTDFSFVTVNICTVDMTIADIDSIFYGLGDLANGRL